MSERVPDRQRYHREIERGGVKGRLSNQIRECMFSGIQLLLWDVYILELLACFSVANRFPQLQLCLQYNVYNRLDATYI